MDNNDVFRRLRYVFDFNEFKVEDMFKLTGAAVELEVVSGWLKKEDDAGYREMKDISLASFLNGFIIDKRGKREGPLPVPEKELTNNIILRKLKIALNLKTDDIQEVLKVAGIRTSIHEINSFFRKPKQNQYRVCLDQFLRNFLIGLQKQYRN